MDALSKSFLPLLTAFDSQGLSNTAWAYAKLSLMDQSVLDAILLGSFGIVAGLRGQDLSNMFWAFATSQLVNWPLFAAISAQALRKLSQFQS